MGILRGQTAILLKEISLAPAQSSRVSCPGAIPPCLPLPEPPRGFMLLSRWHHPLLPLAGLLSLPLVGCTVAVEEDDDDNDSTSASMEVTFHRDVEPILQEHCQDCHNSNGIAPFSLMTYEDAAAHDYTIAQEALSGAMPPWGAIATEEWEPRFPWKDDPTLTHDEIEILQSWSELNAPKGDEADAPPYREPNLPGLEDADITVTPETSYTVTSGPDDFRCFVLDPQLTEDRYLKALDVVPGNNRVVHHVLVFLDTERESESLDDGEGSYDCFGSSGVNAGPLAGWAPGMTSLALPDEAGMPLPAGSLLVMQVHYHPTPEGTAEEDATTLQLRTTTDVPSWQAGVYLLGNFSQQYHGDRDYMADGDGLQPGVNDRTSEAEFRIPAGEAAHVETMRYTFVDLYGLSAIKILGVASHMHYVGTDLFTEVNHKEARNGEPQREGLLQTPAWDFNWQRTYFYDVPIEEAPEVREGDEMWIRCTYDNTLDNDFVAEALEDQGLLEPKDVYLGEETLDEMCLTALVYAYNFTF